MLARFPDDGAYKQGAYFTNRKLKTMPKRPGLQNFKADTQSRRNNGCLALESKSVVEEETKEARREE